MTILPEIQAFVNRLSQELDETEQEAIEGLNLVRQKLSLFPDNQILTQDSFGKPTMTQPFMTDSQVAELRELLELAKMTEQKAKELTDLTLEIDQKYEKRLAEIRVARKLQSVGILPN